MIKPDGVQRNLVGDIIKRFETKGFKLIGLKLMSVSRELAEKHYEIHKERPFFESLVEFIISSPVVAMVWEGKDKDKDKPGIIESARKIIGSTNPLEAAPGSIRGDYGVDVGRNLIHGSDSVENAEKEINLWFKEEELCDWKPDIHKWLYE
jgi:nucleoside-diphosphate kinase